MSETQTVDQLPPESRFALRAVAAGLEVDEAGLLMRLPGPKVRQHLRTAGRRLGIPALSYADGDAPFLAALAPALAAAREPPSRPSSKRCPDADVAAALAALQLDGPLMLAEIDHVADCPACLARLIELRRTAGEPAPHDAPAAKIPWLVIVGVAAAVAAAWFLLR